MGEIYSFFYGEYHKNDDPDSVTGLTSLDKFNVKTSWTRISKERKNVQIIGIAVFINLFEKNPNYQKLFPFCDIPIDQLPKNNKFKAHCVTVMYAFSALVDNIEDSLILEQLLAKQATSHVSRKVPNSAYLDLKDVLLKLFAASMNANELNSWEKFLTIGFEIMLKNADEYLQTS